jgi:hypothetical protein
LYCKSIHRHSYRDVWEVVKNLEMSLFVDYIKFDPQTFNCYI